jgi:hypothetical protein
LIVFAWGCERAGAGDVVVNGSRACGVGIRGATAGESLERKDSYRRFLTAAVACSKCKGYMGVVIPEGKRSRPVKAINGICVQCGYRLAWIVIRGKNVLRESVAHRDMSF